MSDDLPTRMKKMGDTGTLHRIEARPLLYEGAATISQQQQTIEQMKARMAKLEMAAQGVLDWADLAMSNPDEFNSHGVRNLDGPAFDELRAVMAVK